MPPQPTTASTRKPAKVLPSGRGGCIAVTDRAALAGDPPVSGSISLGGDSARAGPADRMLGSPGWRARSDVVLPAGNLYPWKRRNTATAFCPPNPKPLIIAVSTLALRLTLGT